MHSFVLLEQYAYIKDFIERCEINDYWLLAKVEMQLFKTCNFYTFVC